MQLTDAQKQTIRKWAEDGIGLSDIQKKLASELQISMTYMDVRLLMIEEKFQVKDKKPTPPTPVMAKTAPPSAMGGAGDADDAAFADEPSTGAAPGIGRVTVEVSRLARPGAIVSGSVTFSDGVTATWSLDQLGRLSLAPAKQGYRPVEADVEAFQLELRRVLSAKGF